MKKSVFILLLLFIIPVWSQNAMDSTEVNKSDVVQSVIIIDTTVIESIHFKENLKEKYNDKAFVYEEKAPIKSVWDRFVEWFTQWMSRNFDMQDGENAKNIVSYIINTIAIILILLVVFLIAKALLNKEGTWIFGSKSDANLIRYDEIEKNLHLVDFEKLIKQSIQSGEHRLSIRYYYLFLLKKMSEKELIEWDVEKTNSDYIYEIKLPQLKADFEYLSYLYNYIWYGEFDLSTQEFEKAKKAFDTTIKSIY
ncbi:DUF4129 domain-containing protein [Flavobacterium antarcticum]|uniref:DUF4129 domain-containing protein n=1 Tax=Flavobacterium antarcticum TaxID=271155 RepID=UPI001B7FE091|nr:DUF4129 domain-containing protein [Flavobacterium antarcticum]